MKTLGALCVVVGCAIVSVVVSAQSPSVSQHKTTIDQSCVTCHNQRLKTGGLALDALDIANVQRPRRDLGERRPQAARRRHAAARRSPARSADH